VAEPPEVRGATRRFPLALTGIDTDAGPVPASGKALVRVAASQGQREGDLVRVTGRVELPPRLDSFDYRAYLARRDIHAVIEFPRVRVVGHARVRGPRAWLQGARTRARDALWEGLPAEQAALASGILLGQRGEIPRTLTDEWNRAGVSHLIVISGFNIALVGGLVTSAGAWLLGRRRAALLALVTIWLYSVFVGLSPPVARAAVMGSLAVVALIAGRPAGGGTSLVIAAALLTVPDPRILEDVSFQLSFAATAGLVLLAPPLIERGRLLLSDPARAEHPTWRALALAAWSTLAVTLAATAATLPLMVIYFGRLSLISPLSNLILVPLFPAVLVAGALGIATTTLAHVSPSLALLPLGGLLELAIGVTRRCAALPWAAVTVHGDGRLAVVVYALLALPALARLPGRRPKEDGTSRHLPAALSGRPVPLLAFAPAALLLLAAGTRVLDRPALPRETRVDVINLSGATLALVTLAGGGYVLVDTGPSPGGARTALDRLLPEGAALAGVILTGAHASALAGLPEVLARYRVAALLVPPEAIEQVSWRVEGSGQPETRLLPLRPDLTLGNGRAQLTLTPAREPGRWSVTVREGRRAIVLGEGEGDARVARAGRETAISLRVDGGRLRLALRSGEAAVIRTDGRRLRLEPPREKQAELIRCLPPCALVESK